MALLSASCRVFSASCTPAPAPPRLARPSHLPPLRSLPPPLLRLHCTLPPLPSTTSRNTLLTVLLASTACGFLLHTLAAPDAALASTSSSLSSLGIPVESDLRALALGPEGPLVEEFWDNMRRYGFYFLTVVSGGIYSLLQPLFALFKKPLTAILAVVVISGSIYLVYLTLNTMLGLNAFDYRYS